MPAWSPHGALSLARGANVAPSEASVGSDRYVYFSAAQEDETVYRQPTCLCRRAQLGVAACDPAWRYGHLFPIPFEYQALVDEWPGLLNALTERSFRKLPLRSHMAWAVPKGHTGFRIAHQLDPLDTLVYTALVYEMGRVIERARQPRTVACAYRFLPEKQGTSTHATTVGRRSRGVQGNLPTSTCSCFTWTLRTSQPDLPPSSRWRA